MNYYNIDTMSKLVLKSLRQNGYDQLHSMCPFSFDNMGRDNTHIDIMLSKTNVYMSEKDVMLKMFKFQDRLQERGADVNWSQVNLEAAKINTTQLEPDEHLVNFTGILSSHRAFIYLRKAAKHEIKTNPYYVYFKNLSELSNNKEKCISLDFEFSVTHGVTELGATYYENNKLTTKWFRIKNTPNRNKPSNFNENAEMIDLKQMKVLLQKYYKKFDTFVFHDYSAEKTIMQRLFKGVKGTPFDGTKKIIDTRRASSYIRQRDERHANSGFNDTLEGLCKATNIKASGFHNAANDTRFTFSVARKLSSRYRQLWEKYIERDINNPIKRINKVTLK